MAVQIPGSVVGNIASEYAAVSINITRLVVAANDGSLIPAYTVSLSYDKKEYLLDESGKKVALVNRHENLGIVPDNKNTIFLDRDATQGLFAKEMAAGDLLGDVIATAADSLIHEDLVKRGILVA